MTLYGDTHYAMADSALDQAWDAITDPPGQPLDAEGNRIPWAAAAIGVAIGHALLALCDELKANRP